MAFTHTTSLSGLPHLGPPRGAQPGVVKQVADASSSFERVVVSIQKYRWPVLLAGPPPLEQVTTYCACIFPRILAALRKLLVRKSRLILVIYLILIPLGQAS